MFQGSKIPPATDPVLNTSNPQVAFELQVNASTPSAAPRFSATFLSDPGNYVFISETPVPSPTPRPTATPTPVPVIPVNDGQMNEWFDRYSSYYSVDKELLKRIAYCESHMNPSAISKYYGGMFQFSVNSWIAVRNRMNMDPKPDLRFNAEEAIRTAAFKISTDGSSAWPNCRK